MCVHILPIIGFFNEIAHEQSDVGGFMSCRQKLKLDEVLHDLLPAFL